MAKRFMCVDGVMRTDREYNAWLRNLMKLYECEREDLTDEELDALRDAGCIDD